LVFNAYSSNAQNHVVKKDKYLNCSCLESNFDGVPCRHELAMCILKFKDPMTLYFAKRWEIKYFNFTEPQIHQSSSNQVSSGYLIEILTFSKDI